MYSIRHLLHKGHFLGTPIVPTALPAHPPRHAVAAVEEEEKAAVVGEVVEEGLDLRPGAPHEEVLMTAPSPRSLLIIPPNCVCRRR